MQRRTCACLPPCEPPAGRIDYNGRDGQGYQPAWCSKPVMNPPRGDGRMTLARTEHGYAPDFQMRHCRSGEIIRFNRLYTSKQLRKLLGVKSDDWSRVVGYGRIPERDTYIDGEPVWTDTTLKDLLATPFVWSELLTPGQRGVITHLNEESPAA